MWFLPISSSEPISTETPDTPTPGVQSNATPAKAEVIPFTTLPDDTIVATEAGQLVSVQQVPTYTPVVVPPTNRVVEVPSVAPIPFGQQAFTTPGTFSWVCPPSVTSVAVVAVGGGGGGGDGWANPGGSGGGLAWRNNIRVVPGRTYTVQVGAGGGNFANGGNSFFNDLNTVAGYGGGGGGGGSTGGPNQNGIGGGYFAGPEGPNGGGGAGGNSQSWVGGGGAGGYTARGGNVNEPAPSPGGGASGGNHHSSTHGTGAGGGVGILGLGPSGTTNFTPWSGYSSSYGSNAGGGGQGGSGGEDGFFGQNPWSGTGSPGGSNNIRGGNFGGGGGGPGTSWPASSGDGGSGAVRIIWGRVPGVTRTFPSNNTGNL